jgi:alkylation response protein AidB-like acyl-CoA dehydrogenase
MDFSLTESQRQIQARARDFAQRRVAPLSREMDERREMPRELIAEMAALGFLGGPLPKEYGGEGWDAVSLALCYEELGRADSSVRGFMTVHTSLVAQCLLNWGTEEVKGAYLPKLARGEIIGCYCLTEPNAGSDAAALESTAALEGDEYVVDGDKIWITNGGIADLAIVFARSTPLPGQRGESRHKGICALLVPTDSPGFRREKMKGRELGHRASDHAHIRFNQMRVPKTALLAGHGEGLKVAMAGLGYGRLGVAAGAVGVGQACLDACIEFAKTRRQFGQRIGNFEMIQAALADMAADIQAARMLVYHAAWLRDQGERATRETSTAKLFATEAAVRAANEAVLLHGGRGYSDEYPVERYLRDIKGLQIYEGTAHIQRIVIARELLGEE